LIPSKTQVTKAGKILLSSKTEEERNKALEVINQWRTIHLSPLTVMKTYFSKLLTNNAITPVLISQRLKRLNSIEYKLDLNRNMALGGMQDIGGFRIVVKDTKDLLKLKTLIEENAKTSRYSLEYIDDYISAPRKTGYRSIHYIYSYHSKVPQCDGVKLELQIRTKLQHNWATAVETAGIFTKTVLKSGQGPDDWLEFFEVVGSLFAIKEKFSVLEKHREMLMEDLMIRCYQLTSKLKILEILNALRVSARHIEIEKVEGDYYLLQINFKVRNVNILVFPKRQYKYATSEYLKLEKSIEPLDSAVVLVAANSIKSLKKAYPSYFLDTSEFIEALERVNKNCKMLNLVKD
jgi:putative GTP pyrophosphokinase